MQKSTFLSTVEGRGDRGIGWMLALSIFAHLLVILLMVAMMAPAVDRKEKHQVYYVDLISKPVANPKAGHPEGGSPDPGPKSTKPAAPGPPAPAPQAPASSAAPSAPVPKAAPQPKVAPQPKAEPQPKTEPAPAKPAQKKAAPANLPEPVTKAVPKTEPRQTAKTPAPAPSQAVAKTASKTVPPPAKTDTTAPKTAPQTKTVADGKTASKETSAKTASSPSTAAPAKNSPQTSGKGKDKSLDSQYQQVQNTVAALQQKKAAEAKQRSAEADVAGKIAALGRKHGSGSGSGSGNGGSGNGGGGGGALGPGRVNAPLGTPDGTGTEEGVPVAPWLQKVFESNWWLSPDQKSAFKRRGLETKIRVVYDAAGNLKHKEIVKSSGDRVFDQSVEAAVQKSSKLPQPLPAPFDGTVIFNLRELQR